MESTEQPMPKQRIRRAVSPEIAALVREEAEMLKATRQTAETLAQSAVSAAQAAVVAAEAKCKAALRPVMTQLGFHEAEFVGWDGFGADTVLILEVPAPTEG